MSDTVRIEGNPAELRPPSSRELLQARLIAFLTPHASRWTAAYGLVPGVEPMPNGGAARSVYFGVDDVIDVRVTIFTPRDFVVTAAGDLSHLIEGRYQDVSQVEAGITRITHALGWPIS